MLHPRDLVAFSTGEYSDYQTTTYRVLKPFTLGDIFSKFEAAQPQQAVYLYDQRINTFIPWLIQEGYVEDADIMEVHLGNYGLDIRLSDAQKTFGFSPIKRRKA